MHNLVKIAHYSDYMFIKFIEHLPKSLKTKVLEYFRNPGTLSLLDQISNDCTLEYWFL